MKPLQTDGQRADRLASLHGRRNTNVTLVHPSPLEQITRAPAQIFSTVRRVVSPKTDIGVQQLGGAVMIIRVY